jgi:hypothetical protein
MRCGMLGSLSAVFLLGVDCSCICRQEDPAKDSVSRDKTVTVLGNKEKQSMDNVQKFENLRDQWTAHCERVRFSANMNEYLSHPAFKKLIELGPAAVPLIMERYQQEEMPPWEFVLQEITGVRLITDPDSFDLSEARNRRQIWWEKERATYPHPSTPGKSPRSR